MTKDERWQIVELEKRTVHKQRFIPMLPCFGGGVSNTSST